MYCIARPSSLNDPRKVRVQKRHILSEPEEESDASSETSWPRKSYEEQQQHSDLSLDVPSFEIS